MNILDIQQIFNQFPQIKVAVVGDIMLDIYTWGNVERISPEAPVPIVMVGEDEYRIGGAGNVALNLAALEAQVYVFSVAGNDAQANFLTRLMENKNINTDNIVRDDTRSTTTKTRIMARNQQIMRLDKECKEDISLPIENSLFHKLTKFIQEEKPQLLILEDYNKGVLTPGFIQKAITLAKQNHVLVTVDPKRKNFFNYIGVDIFKPNLKEVKDALSLYPESYDIASLSEIHRSLEEKLHHHFSLITLSEKGIFYQEKNDEPQLLPAKVRNIADVSGAGDTVIAVLSLAFAVSGNMRLSAELANIAGGLVCEQVGTAPINKDRLIEEGRNLDKY